MADGGGALKGGLERLMSGGLGGIRIRNLSVSSKLGTQCTLCKKCNIPILYVAIKSYPVLPPQVISREP